MGRSASCESVLTKKKQDNVWLDSETNCLQAHSLNLFFWILSGVIIDTFLNSGWERFGRAGFNVITREFKNLISDGVHAVYLMFCSASLKASSSGDCFVLRMFSFSNTTVVNWCHIIYKLSNDVHLFSVTLTGLTHFRCIMKALEEDPIGQNHPLGLRWFHQMAYRVLVTSESENWWCIDHCTRS